MILGLCYWLHIEVITNCIWILFFFFFIPETSPEYSYLFFYPDCVIPLFFLNDGNKTFLWVSLALQAIKHNFKGVFFLLGFILHGFCPGQTMLSIFEIWTTLVYYLFIYLFIIPQLDSPPSNFHKQVFVLWENYQNDIY